MAQPRSTHGLAALLLCCCLLAACNARDTTETHVATPAPSIGPAPPAAPSTPLNRSDNVAEPKANPIRSAVASTKSAEAKPAPVAAPSAPATHVTQPPAPSAAPPAPKRTPLPQTAHVRFAVAEPLQQLLDADGRMDGWLNHVLVVIDRCYLTALDANPNAAGIVTAEVIMHENARPNVDLHETPDALANVVECASGSLINKRPPLFTGPEGQRHVVSVHFSR
jgi:hypothetical protein